MRFYRFPFHGLPLALPGILAINCGGAPDTAFACRPESAAANRPVQSREISKAKKMRVYIGTYTGGKSKGIYLFTLDRESGALTSQGIAAESASPSFLALHPNRRFL